MPYNVVFTHNPQEFFEGYEPDELTEFAKLTKDEISTITDRIDGGYYAIISKCEEAE